jgi:phage terminase large subunit
MTNADIIEFLSHEARGDIFGDPSSKMMLEEIRRAGYSAYEGHKGVKESIDLCQRQKLVIPEASQNLTREIRSYTWKKNKDGLGGGFMPEPVKFNDHAVDAMRYAIWGLTERYGFATARPIATEPIKSLTFGNSGSNSRVLDRWLRRDNG